MIGLNDSGYYSISDPNAFKIDANYSELKDVLYKFTYESCAIDEQNLTLTLPQIKEIIEDGALIPDLSEIDRKKIINHHKALLYVIEMAKYRVHLDKSSINSIYSLLMGIPQSETGYYRNEPKYIKYATHIPTDYYLIEARLDELLKWYEDAKNKNVNKIVRIAILHAEFERIQPFDTGNGRVGRLIMNLELLKEGLPLTIIKNNNRLAYYNVLENIGSYQEPKYGDIIWFLESSMAKSKYRIEKAKVDIDTI